MSDFGRGRTYPLDPKNNGPVVGPVVVMSAEGTESGYLQGDSIVLTPNYPQLLRWFINAMATDSFDGYEGRQKALHSILDIARYLAIKDIEELTKIMGEIA